MIAQRSPKYGKSRLRRSTPSAYGDEEFIEVEDVILVALSGLRFFSRLKPLLTRSQIMNGSTSVPIDVDFLMNRRRIRRLVSIPSARFQVTPRKRSASPTFRVHPSACCCRIQTMENYLAPTPITLSRSRYTDILPPDIVHTSRLSRPGG